MNNASVPDVSVIVVNYNTFQLTLNCIQSIRENSKGIHIEIILVDNNSTERLADDFLRYDAAINLIKSSINVGFAKGNNLGILQANGKYVLLANSDVVLKNDAINKLKDFLEINPKVAVATGRLEYPDGGIQHNCQRFPNISFQLIEFFRLQKIFPALRQKLFGPFFSYDRIAYPDWVWGTFFMFPKSLLDKFPNKKLADDFFLYTEDMQWCMNFSKLGYKVAFCPNAHIIHHMGASGGNKDLIKINETVFMKLYYPPWKRRVIAFLDHLLTLGHAA